MAKDKKDLKAWEKDLEKREKALNDRAEELDVRQKAQADEGAKLEERETALADWEESLGKDQKEIEKIKIENEELKKALVETEGLTPGAVEPVEEEPELSEEDLAVIKAGCEAYGIESRFVFNARIDRLSGEAVILTNGGKKVRYLPGYEEKKDFRKLNEIEVTGINPKNEKRKPITGKK